MDSELFKGIIQEFIEFIDLILSIDPDRYLRALNLVQTRCPDLFLFHGNAHVLSQPLDGAFHGFFSLNFQNKVHAALKVQSQVDFLVRPDLGLECGYGVNNGSQNDQYAGYQFP